MTDAKKILQLSVEWVSVFFIVFGGIFPYIPQYIQIMQTKNVAGFSTFVCLTLIVSNILRIAFWYTRRFELPLLFQSFLMLIVMSLLMQICVQYQQNDENYTIFNSPVKRFWQWSNLASYFLFVSLFAASLAAVVTVNKDNYALMEFVGLASAIFESMLAVPQVVTNFNRGSTLGMSLAMVFLWTAGDAFKSLYFFIRRAPLQFLLAGMLQITMDLIIFLQYVYYS